jgi:hypothetical protein
MSNLLNSHLLNSHLDRGVKQITTINLAHAQAVYGIGLYSINKNH